jgi:hypothetical protein
MARVPICIACVVLAEFPAKITEQIGARNQTGKLLAADDQSHQPLI